MGLAEQLLRMVRSVEAYSIDGKAKAHAYELLGRKVALEFPTIIAALEAQEKNDAT